MLVYILLFIFIILAILNFEYVGHDVFDPFTLYIAGFILAIIATIFNIKHWGVNLGFKTFGILLLGVIAFFAGSVLSKNIHGNSIYFYEREIIVIDKWKVFLTIALDIVLTVWQWREVVRVSTYANSYYLDLGIMTAYKSALNEGYEMNNLLNQLLKISSGMAYVFLFVIINNCTLAKDRRIRDNWLYSMPIIIFIIQSFIKGGRGGLIVVFIATMFLIYYFTKIDHNWERIVSDKYIKRMVVSVALVAVAFYFTKEIVGRVTDENFLEYITRYFGGSIALLDLYLKNPRSTSNVFGGESLTGLINSLSKIGIGAGGLSVSLEFRNSSTGVSLGNVYTQLRRAYNDFGILGVFFMPFILSTFYNFFYHKIKRIQSFNWNSIFRIILYSSLIGYLPLQAMEDQIFISKISIGFIVQVIALYFCTWFLLELKAEV